MWLTLVLAASISGSISARTAPADVVGISRLPDGCVQPATLVSPDGALRVVCLSGDPKSSEVLLLKRAPNQVGFDPPEQVNFIPGAAVATGTIRGPRVALGQRGRLHIIWNGSKAAGDSLVSDGPLVYTRSDPATGAFERERDLMGETTALDGGAAIVSDGKGTVIVAWHATGPGLAADESHRNIFVRRSTDDGETWERAVPVLDEAGVCACCSIAAGLSAQGQPLLLYRGAKTLTDRDMQLVTLPPLTGRVQRPLHVEELDRWETRTCPMSSCDFTTGQGRTFAAWENRGQVFAAEVRPDGTIFPRLTPAGSTETRKHPRLTMNSRAELLMVWTEDTAWNKGGSVAWQLFAPTGEPLESGRAEGLPARDFAEPVPMPGERFDILY
jgi:hypothetical protein